MVGVVAHSAIDRVNAKPRSDTDSVTRVKCKIFSLPSSIQCTLYTGLDSTRQLLLPGRFTQHKSPSLVKNSLDVTGYVDHLLRGYDFVITKHIPIKHLVVPKAVSELAILIQVLNFGYVFDSTLASERGKRARVGVH